MLPRLGFQFLSKDDNECEDLLQSVSQPNSTDTPVVQQDTEIIQPSGKEDVTV